LRVKVWAKVARVPIHTRGGQLGGAGGWCWRRHQGFHAVDGSGQVIKARVRIAAKRVRAPSDLMYHELGVFGSLGPVTEDWSCVRIHGIFGSGSWPTATPA